jgi:paraquat-inducible protein B
VQGLDIGSKLKYRGVSIGEVTRIGFTYNKYQLDKPMSERYRYVLVEAQLEPRLLGGRAGAGDLTDPESASMEVERGLRMRLAPQGITGTSYLEIDYADPPPPILPIDWTPDNIYIPSAPSTVTAIVNAAAEIMDRLHKLDIEGTVANFNKLLVTTNSRIDAIDAKAISQRTERVLAKVETTLDSIDSKKLSTEAVALLAELRASNAELNKTLANPALQKLPDDAAAAMARVKDLVSDPKLAKTLSSLERTMSRLDRIFGGGEADLATTIDNLRQITDNLRDLTEETKRYPANVIFGAPPPPLERKP